MVRPLERRPDVRLIRARRGSGNGLRPQVQEAGGDRAACAAYMTEVPMAGIVHARLVPDTLPYGLSSGWSDAGLTLACNGSADLLPLRLCRIPRGTTSSAAAVLR